MTTYKINTAQASNSTAQLRNIGSSLNTLQSQLHTVRTSMDVQTLSINRLKALIRTSESNILDIAADMDTLAEALDTVINYYISTENSILSTIGCAAPSADTTADSDGAFRNWIQQLIDRFREWLISIGIDLNPTEGTITKSQEEEHDLYMRSQIDALLEQERFSESYWANASVEERKEILNEYLQEVAAIMGLSIGAINFTYTEGQTVNGVTYFNMGSYNSRMNRVSINEWVLEHPSINSYSLMETIVHEMRHAYQHAACENPENFNVSAETIAQWQESFDNYRSSSDYMRDYGMSQSEAHEAYRNQAVEQDARRFAGQD